MKHFLAVIAKPAAKSEPATNLVRLGNFAGVNGPIVKTPAPPRPPTRSRSAPNRKIDLSRN